MKPPNMKVKTARLPMSREKPKCSWFIIGSVMAARKPMKNSTTAKNPKTIFNILSHSSFTNVKNGVVREKSPVSCLNGNLNCLKMLLEIIKTIANAMKINLGKINVRFC